MLINTGALRIVAAVVALGAAASWCQAAVVTPVIGGGEVGLSGAAMKHADIMFDGTNIDVTLDTSVPTPVLRPLSAGNTFDPAQPWSVLIGKAYNYQFAWNLGGFFTPPTGTAVWVQRISQDSELQVYMRPPQWTSALGSKWTSIFQADGDIWKWGGSMQHNAYAILNPTKSSYSATYEVYIGDANTGAPLAQYGSDTVTFDWAATPVPEPATVSLLALGALAIFRKRIRPGRAAE